MRTPQNRRHPTALRPEIVEQIRIEYWTSDVTLKELAARYGRTTGAIWQTISGRLYRTAPGPTSLDAARALQANTEVR